jgi:hypothetical protein
LRERSGPPLPLSLDSHLHIVNLGGVHPGDKLKGAGKVSPTALGAGNVLERVFSREYLDG